MGLYIYVIYCSRSAGKYPLQSLHYGFRSLVFLDFGRNSWFLVETAFFGQNPQFLVLNPLKLQILCETKAHLPRKVIPYICRIGSLGIGIGLAVLNWEMSIF